MEVPAHIAEGLRNIRSGMHLRFNPTAVLVSSEGFDVNGKPRRRTYAPRFEVWDTDPQGREYMVMRVQTPEGEFRFPDEKLVERINQLNPEKYNGDLDKILAVHLDEPERLREIGTMKDSDDLIEAVAKWAQWCETPKSGSGLIFRGKRILS